MIVKLNTMEQIPIMSITAKLVNGMWLSKEEMRR